MAFYPDDAVSSWNSHPQLCDGHARALYSALRTVFGISFAMFLAFAFSGGPGFVSSPTVTASQSVQDARERVAERQTDVREAETEVSEATTELARVRSDPDPMPGEEGSAVGALSSAQGVLTGAQARLASAQNELSRVQEAAAAQRAQKPATSTSFKTEQEKSAALAEIEQDLIQARRENASVEVNALMLAKQVVSAAPIVADGSDVKAKDGGNAPKQITAKIELDDQSADIVLDQSRNIMEMLKDSMRRGDFIVTSSPELNKKIAEKVKNPELFLYKLQNTVYKFSFILVPLSLPFIWLLFFWKRGVTMFDHAVFALYSLSFVSFLFLMVSVLAHLAPASKILPYAVLVLPVHLFFQFKGAYALGWFSALWRTIVFGGLFSWVILMAFVLAIVALGVTG